MKPIWLNVSNNFLPDWLLLLLCTAPFTKLKTFRCTKAGLMFKAFCLATKKPTLPKWMANVWHYSCIKQKRESSETTCDDIEFGMKNVMQNSSESSSFSSSGFFCADKSLIQHTHTEIVHYIKNMKNDAFQKAAKESRLKVCHISWVDETQPSDSILKKLPDIRGKKFANNL